VAVALQPLQPSPSAGQRDAVPPALAAIAKAHGRRQYGVACQASARLWQARMTEASRLFYGPDRRKADTAAIERFLDQHVRGPKAVLSIAAEGFAPAVAWRNLAVDACVRAGDGATAVRFVAASASEQRGAPRLALAVALALQAGRWSAAEEALVDAEDSLRLPLWRALLSPAQAQTWLQAAAKSAQSTADSAPIAAVRAHLGAK
jgi:hypothetical protein